MIYLFFLLLCTIPFLPAWWGPLRIHDDQSSIVSLKADYFDSPARGWIWHSARPMYNLINHFNYRLARRSFWPTYWHVMNSLLHWLSVCSLFHLLTRLDVQSGLWIASAFAVHPLQTASVAYVTGRSGILAGLFLFLGATVYLWPFPGCLLATLIFPLAYLSRPDAIVCLAWLPVLEYFR